MGVAFDGDGDRVILIDHQGEILDGDDILFIIAKNYQSKGQALTGIVGTHMSNLGLELALKKMGIAFDRVQVGDRYVMEALKNKQWTVGGEPSGHIICLDVTSTGDGIISALQVITVVCQSGVSLHELKSGLTKLPQSMINVKIDNNENVAVLQQAAIRTAVNDAESQLGAHGRVLLRPSGTEPLIRVMVEGESREEVQRLAERLAGVVKSECG
jgi:phosphoglucosamine mutase